jgi:serine protease Do
MVDFADAVERINPTVVSIEAAARIVHDRHRPRRGLTPNEPDLFGDPLDFGLPRDSGSTRRGSGSGFIIDASGSILTNHHVIEGAERIIVTLSDGRSLRARLIGSDPDTDVALIKVDGQSAFPAAPLGDSSTLRIGEWVCAIGNPLGYEHTVTVGVVSFLGRKLFDPSLDDYIQTDAAISFGNSGGPLINSRGEVVGINAAISSRGSNIGFAVPIRSAREILSQLRSSGRVSRGYMGVTLKSVDADLRQSLGLGLEHGALVQDVSDGSPAATAGLRPYDVVVGLDDREITDEDQLIREIAIRSPGTSTHVAYVRDGRVEHLTLQLAERPARPGTETRRPSPTSLKADPSLLGLSVRTLDQRTVDRLALPRDMKGLLITGVEPLSTSSDSGIERGSVLLEINRQPVESVSDFRRIVHTTRPGDVLALYLFSPDFDQRQLKTVRVEGR